MKEDEIINSEVFNTHLGSVRKHWLPLLIVLMILIASHYLVGYKWYVKGGRVACKNSDSRLVEGFECEKVIREPQRLDGRLSVINITGVT